MYRLVAEYEFDRLPVSVNSMYFFSKRKTRPTKKLNEFKSDSLKQLEEQKVIKLEKNVPYLLEVDFYFQILNKGFEAGTAKSKYKKRDTSNLIKSIEDVVTKASDIDDSQIIELKCRKFDCAQVRTVVRLYQIEEN